MARRFVYSLLLSKVVRPYQKPECAHSTII